MDNKAKGFDKRWFEYVEMPDEDLAHCVFADDPIQGVCLAAFNTATAALCYQKELQIEQLQKEYVYWATVNKENPSELKAKTCPEAYYSALADELQLKLDKLQHTHWMPIASPKN